MLELIGAGFGRTGTTSLKEALQQLGLSPCYHMFEVIADPAKGEDWLPAARGEEPDWESVFAGYRATVDWPGAAFWRQLAERYPQAKVLLTTRDPQRWYDSVYNTIYQFSKMSGPAEPPVEPGSAEERHRMAMGEFMRTVVWENTFGNRFEDREHAVEVFQRHVAEVRETIPAERLLVYEVSQGWEPLCEFLGVPVPDLEFPHLNDTETMREMVRQMREHGKLISPFTSR